MLKIKSFQKKILKISIMTFLVMISSILFTNSVSALETTSGSFPDIPDGFDKFIIARSSSDTADVLYAWKSSATVYVHNFSNQAFYFSNSMSDINSLNTTSVSIYVLESDEWVYREKTGNAVWGHSKIYATNVYIKGYHLSDTSYGAGYGLSEKPSSNIYDMSSWIDIGEFTLLNENMTPEDYYIIIWEESEIAGYRLVCWKKNGDASIYASVLGQGGVFPYTPTITFFYADDELKNVSYYDETEPFSKIINSARTNTGSTFEASKIVYSNVDIWNLYDNGTEAYKWFDVSKVNYESTSFNEFNENIDVTDISKIKINFELPEDTSNLDVDISWTFDNLIEGGNGIFTTPYLELIHVNGDVTLTQSLDSLYAGQWFSDNYNITFLPDSDITTINLIVDVMDATGLMNVIFSSKFSYDISYEYISDVEDYFITIDMDDYASISLIPKVYNIETGISSSISSPIYKYGIYDIEIWEDLETKEVIDRWDSHISSYFVYPIYSDYKNCVIHFIKKEVDASNRYVKFDSRYYSYVLKKYLNEEVIITNPNTNKDVTISDISDLYNYNSSVDNRFSFNSFLKPIKFVFESITNFYNNYCPEVVQYFFYIIFSFFIILVLIKIFL